MAAIQPAENEQFCQLFINEGKPMVALLQKTRNILERQESAATETMQTRQLIDNVWERIKAAHDTNEGKKITAGDYGITAREKMVLQHLSYGLSYDEIARILVVSPNTIKTHINRLYRKMGVRNRLQAVKTAHELGWYD